MKRLPARYGLRSALLLWCSAGVLLATAAAAPAQNASSLEPHFAWTQHGLQMDAGADRLQVEVVEDGLVRIHVVPAGKAGMRTPVLAPEPHFHALSACNERHANGEYLFSTPRMTVAVKDAAPYSLAVRESQGRTLLEINDPLRGAQSGSVTLQHEEGETFYGVSGLPLQDNGGTLLRNGGGFVRAGIQGESGAPYTFTTRYGVLVDSDGGDFTSWDDRFTFRHGSRPDLELFIAVGPPLATMGMLSRIVGPPPMPPRWTLGFLNSQWGADEAEVRQIVARYREEHLPLDGFILDFDWKAWGEDNYGEWRWNSSAGPGASAPDKFPNGASGKFAADLAAQGVKLAGILKPRILTNVAGDSRRLTQAAQYAEDHHFWYPDEIPIDDYVTHRGARNLNFNDPAVRAWFWDHLKPAFHEGMVAWWNDEADISGTTVFNNLQFLNMGRALYDGQRSDSNLRVWSLNRNFYLGASRYGYAGWSGDINTGFQSMAYQRRRMLAALNTGEFQWSMDSGGFIGHPSDENYARWVEFAALVPIMRVHGDLGEKRQPWRYGATAEEAARSAIDLRYSLMPYIYSYERRSAEGDVGLIRPLLWQFPEDTRAAANTDEWMFGDALLVSPVVTKGATVQPIYLPRGAWFDYNKGRHYAGAKEVKLPIDAKSWKDIPIFVRSGSILATQPVLQYDGEVPVTQISLDIFPGTDEASFTVYDDDGATYEYEHGAFLKQGVHAKETGEGLQIRFDPVSGSYASPLQSYVLKIHRSAHEVRWNGHPVSRDVRAGESPAQATTPSWTLTHDKFGPEVLMRVPAERSGMRISLQ